MDNYERKRDKRTCLGLTKSITGRSQPNISHGNRGHHQHGSLHFDVHLLPMAPLTNHFGLLLCLGESSSRTLLRSSFWFSSNPSIWSYVVTSHKVLSLKQETCDYGVTFVFSKIRSGRQTLLTLGIVRKVQTVPSKCWSL